MRLTLLFSIPLFIIACKPSSDLVGVADKGQEIPFYPEDGGNWIELPGGTFNMGNKEIDSLPLRRVTVSSFFIEDTEVANVHYRNFVHWTQQCKGEAVAKEMQPDLSIWDNLKDQTLAENLKKDYFNNPAFNYYPVLGVNWMQTSAFCEWRSNMVNKKILIQNKIIDKAAAEDACYDISADLDSIYKTNSDLSLNKMMILPNYRLPTEAEWEYAANGLNPKELKEAPISKETKFTFKYTKKLVSLVQKNQKQHPLPEYYTQNQKRLPMNIVSGHINSFSLINMNHNAAEWVMDVYRPMNLEKKDFLTPEKRNNPFEYERPAKKTAEEKKRIDGAKIRVFKGGSFADFEILKLPHYRFGHKASSAIQIHGFRCAMTKIGGTKY